MSFPDAEPTHTLDEEVLLLHVLIRVSRRHPAVATGRPPVFGECSWITADDWRIVSFHDGDGPHVWDYIDRFVSPEGKVFAFPFHTAAINNFQPDPTAWIWPKPRRVLPW